MDLEFKKQRNEMIAATILRTATQIKELAAQLPRNGKRGNIFTKRYNRRPRSKQTRMIITMKLWLAANIGAIKLAITLSQPIPKKEFESGGMAMVGETIGVPEHINAMGRIVHAVGNIEWGYIKPEETIERSEWNPPILYSLREPIQIKPLEFPFFAHD